MGVRLAWRLAALLAGVFIGGSALAAGPVALPDIGQSAPGAEPGQGSPQVEPLLPPVPSPMPPLGVPVAPAKEQPKAKEAKQTSTPCDACKPKEVKKDADKKEEKKKDEPKFWWETVPPVAVFPRPAYVPLQPTGPGYYSVADCLHGEYREKPPKYPYPRFSIIQPSFFDIDWRYLDKPDNKDHDTFDCLKRHRFCNDEIMVTTGGELRARYNFEENSRLLNTGRFAGIDNNYDLLRLRLYGDVQVTEYFRFYGEFISATSPDYLLTPLPIDRDPADFLNLFIDLRVCEICDKPVYLRVGRQELLYGSQRLISTLDWANTRRTFQGVKGFWHGDKDDVDVFWVQPVIPNNTHFDSVDNNINFAGLWYTHRPKPGQSIDAYYLLFDNTSPIHVGQFGVRGGRTTNTVGGRWTGDKDGWLWDVEGMVQFGEFSNQSTLANAYTMGVGHHFKDCCTTPMVWLYYDYASGDPNPGQGNIQRTFNQLFPFGHYYFGFVDAVGRQNIHDMSAYLTFWPAKWLQCQAQFHNFYLDSARDALYNAGGVAVRRDPTGRSGTTVGQEIDLVVNFHLDEHSDIFLSYSYLFAGPFIRNTATTPGGQDNPQALYVQYSYRW